MPNNDEIIEELKVKIADYERLIEDIDNKITVKVSQDMQRYNVESGSAGRREVHRIPLSELMKLRDSYKKEIIAISKAIRRLEGSVPRTIRVRLRD